MQTQLSFLEVNQGRVFITNAVKMGILVLTHLKDNETNDCIT